MSRRMDDWEDYLTPEITERVRQILDTFNGNRPGHFPGRPLLEGLIGRHLVEAIMEERYIRPAS